MPNKHHKRPSKPVPAPDRLRRQLAAAPSVSGLPAVILKANEDRRVRRGHLWVFSNEVETFPSGIGAGDGVAFYTSHKEFLGTGFYNPHSLIAGRLIDRRDLVLDAAFFEGRLRRAMELREMFYPGSAYRWIFGESDDLPGLIIDRYGDAIVIESYAAGIDKLLPKIIEAAKLIHPWKAIVLRNDVGPRVLEHLPQKIELLEGNLEERHQFKIDGLNISADLMGGQKTGFFFDQRDNRATAAALCKGKRVADVFSYTGGFGLWAAKAGAASVACVDNSEPALAIAKENFRLNGFSDTVRQAGATPGGDVLFEKADAFDWLSVGKDKFDVVVVDPPKMAPNKKSLPAAIKAYVRLNTLALKRVAGGGFLATASCSQHIEREEFRQILSRAGHESGRRVRLIHWGGQAKDHPVRLSMPETEYLKFAILHVS